MNSVRRETGKSLASFTTKKLESFVLDFANLRGECDDRDLDRVFFHYPEVLKMAGNKDEARSLAWLLRDYLRAAWDTNDLRERDWHLFCLRRQYHVYATMAKHYGSYAAYASRPTSRRRFDLIIPGAPPSESWPDMPTGDLRTLLSVMHREINKFAKERGKPTLPADTLRLVRRRTPDEELVDTLPALTFVEAAVFHFQRISHRARHCPNEGCAAPYFLASKRRQRFCSEPCAAPARRASKRKWWNENQGKVRKK